MTPEQAKTLRWFKWEEFRHPELMSYPFLMFLDAVRFEYGYPLVITSDARTPEENAAAAGSSPQSRHLVGEAVDVRFPPTREHLWLLLAAIIKCQVALPIEVEIVHGPTDSHVHVAFRAVGRASALEVALD